MGLIRHAGYDDSEDDICFIDIERAKQLRGSSAVHHPVPWRLVGIKLAQEQGRKQAYSPEEVRTVVTRLQKEF